jgi:hypothetical protein
VANCKTRTRHVCRIEIPLTQSPKIPAPIAPAAPNNMSRPMTPVALGAAFVVAVTAVPLPPGSDKLTCVGSEALADPLNVTLLCAEVDPVAGPEPLGLLVCTVTSPVASSSRLSITTKISCLAHSVTYIVDLPVAGTLLNPAVKFAATGVIVVK